MESREGVGWIQVGQLNFVSVVNECMGTGRELWVRIERGKNGHEWSGGECAAALVGVEKSCKKYSGKEDVGKVVRDKFLVCKNLIRSDVNMRCEMCKVWCINDEMRE